MWKRTFTSSPSPTDDPTALSDAFNKASHPHRKRSSSSSSPSSPSSPTAPLSSSLAPSSPLPSPPRHSRHWSDYVLLALAIPSLALILHHKLTKERVWFMLQPCHFLHTILIITLILPPGDGLGMLLFNYFIHWIYGPFIGLVGADTSCYTLPYEYVC